MEKAEIKIDYSLYRGEYPEGYENLCRAAQEVLQQAYHVYSGFAVGAALLLEGGEIVCGSNQENIAYPSGLCAERVALFYAGSTWPDRPVRAMAVAARDHGQEVEQPITPCGACRQVMAETIRRHGSDFDVILIGRAQTIVIRAGDLLPFPF